MTSSTYEGEVHKYIHFAYDIEINGYIVWQSKTDTWWIDKKRRIDFETTVRVDLHDKETGRMLTAESRDEILMLGVKHKLWSKADALIHLIKGP